MTEVFELPAYDEAAELFGAPPADEMADRIIAILAMIGERHSREAPLAILMHAARQTVELQGDAYFAALDATIKTGVELRATDHGQLQGLFHAAARYGETRLLSIIIAELFTLYGDQDVNGRTGSTALGVMDTMTFGLGDEIGAGINTAVDAGLHALTGREGKTYTQWHDKLSGLQTNAQDQHPGYYLGGQIAGGAALPGGTAKTLPRMLGEGAAMGAAYGAGSADGTAEDRALGALYGGAAGTGGALVARGIGNAATKRLARDAIPTTEELEAASHAAYNAADAANVVLRPQTVQKMITNAKIGAGRLDDRVRPHTAGIIGDFEAKAGQPMGLREFDDLRKSVGRAINGATDEDAHTLGILRKQMDHMADSLNGSDILGDLDGVYALNDARRLWSMKSKADTVDQMVERAKTTAAGTTNLEGALRNEFKSLAKDSDRMKLFSEAERDAIMKVARGGPVQSVLSLVGKFAPTNPFSALVSGGTGLGVGGGFGAVALPAAGFAAKSAATGMTKGNVQKLDQIIRSGGQTVGDIIQQGRLGTGPGVAAVERGQVLNDRLRRPLATLGSEAVTYSRR